MKRISELAMTKLGDHAARLGASIGGLLAARVLTWTHEEYLAAYLQREVSARESHDSKEMTQCLPTGPRSARPTDIYAACAALRCRRD